METESCSADVLTRKEVSGFGLGRETADRQKPRSALHFREFDVLTKAG